MTTTYDAPPQPESSWARDAARFISAWQLKNCLDFSIFRQLWVEWNFSAIHFSEVPHIQPQFRLQTMYSCFLAYFTRRLPLIIHVGAFYALYMLHQTQQYSPRVPIRVTLSLMKHVQDLCQTAARIANNPILDILAIYNKLLELDAFMITAHLPIPELAEEPSYHEPELDLSLPFTLSSDSMAVTDLAQLAQQYQDLKGSLFHGLEPQMKIVDAAFPSTLEKVVSQSEQLSIAESLSN